MGIVARMWPALLASIVVMAACTRGGPDEGSGTTEWKIAIEEIQGSVQDAWAQRFREEIERRSEGAVKVTVYPYGSLGTSDQLTELVQNGAIQFAMASPGHLGKLIPETQLFLLHFVFPEEDAANRALLGVDGPLRGSFAPLYREKGLRLLSFFTEGWQVWTAGKALRSPKDFAGLKIRVMTSPLLLEAYRAYGADPTPLPYSEVYSALQLGMIDGQVNPLFAIEEMSFYEVSDVLTFANHAQFVTSVVTNPTFFEGLPAARRELVETVVAELEDAIFEVQRDFNASRLEKMKARKPALEVVRLTDDEREVFRRASRPVRETYVELAGPRSRKLLDGLLREVAAGERSGEELSARRGRPEDSRS